MSSISYNYCLSDWLVREESLKIKEESIEIVSLGGGWVAHRLEGQQMWCKKEAQSER